VDFPQDLKYTIDHEWVALRDDGPATVGLTQFAADAMGDVVYVQLPDVGRQLVAGEACGEVESTKSVNEVYSPVSGEVVEVNAAMDTNPGLINSDPYGEAWLFKAAVSGVGDLLSADEYAEHVEKT
jgi:glycine cleavage system H protein